MVGGSRNNQGKKDASSWGIKTNWLVLLLISCTLAEERSPRYELERCAWNSLCLQFLFIFVCLTTYEMLIPQVITTHVPHSFCLFLPKMLFCFSSCCSYVLFCSWFSSHIAFFCSYFYVYVISWLQVGFFRRLQKLGEGETRGSLGEQYQEQERYAEAGVGAGAWAGAGAGAPLPPCYPPLVWKPGSWPSFSPPGGNHTRYTYFELGHIW